MSFEFSAGRFRLFDGADVTVDSDRQNFIVAQYKTGSFVIPPMPATGADDPQIYNLGAVSADATHVVGQFKLSQSTSYSAAGVVNNSWHLIGGTTVIYAGTSRMDNGGFSAQYRTQLTGTNEFAVYLDVTFYLSGARLYASVTRCQPNVVDGSGRGSFVTVNSTIEYHAFLVTFDN